MNRVEWEFEYTASALADGAEKQKTFRQSRLEWWTEQKDALMREIRESGVEVTESVASALAAYTSVSIGPQVSIRPDLQKKLSECHSKIQHHANAIAEYDGWVQVLRANPESRQKLNQDDWLYFFGKK
jgi:L-ribulose-5-phosphate 3-epimerase UlaE